MQGRRVVITGTGVISPVGLDTESFWNALVQGQSGIAALENIDLTGQEVRTWLKGWGSDDEAALPESLAHK
ncbi:MAG: hypothetical protein EOM70_12580 [Clostridia bacterium]|nr:hypothetical protein [Clostridia bacterium]